MNDMTMMVPLNLSMTVMATVRVKVRCPTGGLYVDCPRWEAGLQTRSPTTTRPLAWSGRYLGT